MARDVGGEELQPATVRALGMPFLLEGPDGDVAAADVAEDGRCFASIDSLAIRAPGCSLPRWSARSRLRKGKRGRGAAALLKEGRNTARGWKKGAPTVGLTVLQWRAGALCHQGKEQGHRTAPRRMVAPW